MMDMSLPGIGFGPSNDVSRDDTIFQTGLPIHGNRSPPGLPIQAKGIDFVFSRIERAQLEVSIQMFVHVKYRPVCAKFFVQLLMDDPSREGYRLAVHPSDHITAIFSSDVSGGDEITVLGNTSSQTRNTFGIYQLEMGLVVIT